MFLFLSNFQELILFFVLRSCILFKMYLHRRYTWVMMIQAFVLSTKHVDWPRFLFLHRHLQWGFQLEIIISHDDNITDLPGGECIDNGLIFGCNFNILSTAAIRFERCSKFMCCLWIALWLYQYHSSTNRIRLFL